MCKTEYSNLRDAYWPIIRDTSEVGQPLIHFALDQRIHSLPYHYADTTLHNFMSVDLLILGAGWVSTFLIPLCEDRGITFAATSRSGHDSTIPFTFDPESEDHRQYEVLPDAKTVLITFPIKTNGASQRLVEGYRSTRGVRIDNLSFIQLGTTSIWDVSLIIAHST
jgi:hypothetical protein